MIPRRAPSRAILFVAALLCLLLDPIGSAAAPAAPITGIFYQGDPASPVAGALVVAYRAEGGEIVGSTYSTDSGAFTLPGPGAPARLFVVATKDTSRRLDFDYDPAKPAGPLMIGLPKRGHAAEVAKYLLGKVDAIVGLALGFVSGLLTKRYQDRGLFRIQINALRRIRTRIQEEHDALCAIIDEASGPEPGPDRKSEMERDYDLHRRELRDRLADWTSSNVDVSAVYNLRGRCGLDALAALEEAIRKIKRFSEKAPGNVLWISGEDDIKRDLAPFAALAASKLFEQDRR
jgi:hypothetical protein